MSEFRVLIVDDDAELCDIIRKEIEKHLGREPVIAYDGDDAIEKFSRHQPDVVLLDVMMPKRNGWEACQIMRMIEAEDKDRKRAHIFMVTCIDPWQNQAQAKEYGADEAWNKPINRKSLIQRLKQIRDSLTTA